MRLAEEGRHQRRDQKQDEPRVVEQEPARKRGHGDRILHQREDLARQRHAPARLPPRPLEPILKPRILERGQIEAGRVVHQPHRGGHGEPFRQERVGEAAEPSEKIRQDGEQELRSEQQDERARAFGSDPAERARGGQRASREAHHLVDDELAEPERRDRDQRPGESQDEAQDQKAGARLPDHAEEGRDIAQGRPTGAKSGQVGGGIGSHRRTFGPFAAEVKSALASRPPA